MLQGVEMTRWVLVKKKNPNKKKPQWVGFFFWGCVLSHFVSSHGLNGSPIQCASSTHGMKGYKQCEWLKYCHGIWRQVVELES